MAKLSETEMKTQRVISVLIISLKMHNIAINLIFDLIYSVKIDSCFNFIRVNNVYYKCNHDYNKLI